MVNNHILKQYPLLVRLVCYVLGFSLLVAFCLSAVQVWLEHKEALNELRQNLLELQVSNENSLIENTWNMDTEGINIQLKSLLQFTDVVAVAFIDSNGESIQVGNVPEDLFGSVVHSFSIRKQFENKIIELGTVTLYATLGDMKKRLGQKVPISLIAEAIALLLTGGFILLIFLFKFNRHINRIAEFAENLEITTLDNTLKLDRKQKANSDPDELDRIVHSMNEMRKRLGDGVRAQQQTEERLQREIVFSDAIMNSLPGVFVVYDEQLRAVLFNDLYTQKLGVSPDDVRAYTFMDRVVPEHQQVFLQTLKDIFKNGQQVTIELELHSDFVDKKRIPYLFNGNLVEIEGKKYILGLGTEITDQKKMENALNQAQKMEAIGTLAGGIAHDFNNILSAIMGNLQLAQLSCSEPDKLNGYLQSGIAASLRAKELVKQILAMGRQGQQEKRPLQMSLIIKEALKLLRASIPTTIEIQQDIESEGYILAEATQIHQVVMNLCTNSYQAMQETGGKLTVTLKEKNLSTGKHFPAFDLPAGRYLYLEVADTGHGMDKDTREMIFEPYFTTKESSSGTGLGLAVVHGIVQSHGGYISIYSELGQGTTFRLFFPLLLDPETILTENVSSVDFVMGTENILLVDDEKDILAVGSELLKFHGYSVTTYSSSLDAFQHFKEDPTAYDLVITDMTMPNLSGDLFGEKIKQIRPDIPVIICTGFSKNLEQGGALKAGFASYLTKPVEAGELLLAIRKALDVPGVAKFTALLVDDDQYNRKMMTLLLEAQGHQAVVAENGEICLRKLASQDFDVVFMDMQMPVLDGLQTTEIIRACEHNGPQCEEFTQRTGQQGTRLQGKHVPIVAMTGNLDEESKRKCQKAGMDHFLAKPFRLETVNEILQSLGQQNIAQNAAPQKVENDTGADMAETAMAYLAQVYPLTAEQLGLLLDESVVSLRQSIEIAEQALSKNDFVQLASVAHKMKGTLLGLGADSCVESCKVLEHLAKTFNVSQSKQELNQLTSSLQSLLDKKVP
jgi:PAS domain S-box-containing protein